MGSHLIYFWEGEADFARGVRFLFPGLRSADEHCIAFGHDEALAKVQQVLRSNDFNTDQLIKDGRLTVLRRQSPAQGTVSDISAIIQAALRDGTKAIRFLGNLGMGRDPLPAGEDDVVSLENSVTTLLAQVPCVVVCMYDVQTLSGRMLLRGGLETHKLTVCADGIHDNPHYRPDVDPHIVNRVQ